MKKKCIHENTDAYALTGLRAWNVSKLYAYLNLYGAATQEFRMEDLSLLSQATLKSPCPFEPRSEERLGLPLLVECPEGWHLLDHYENLRNWPNEDKSSTHCFLCVPWEEAEAFCVSTPFAALLIASGRIDMLNEIAIRESKEGDKTNVTA